MLQASGEILYTSSNDKAAKVSSDGTVTWLSGTEPVLITAYEKENPENKIQYFASFEGDVNTENETAAILENTGDETKIENTTNDKTEEEKNTENKTKTNEEMKTADETQTNEEVKANDETKNEEVKTDEQAKENINADTQDGSQNQNNSNTSEAEETRGTKNTEDENYKIKNINGEIHLTVDEYEFIDMALTNDSNTYYNIASYEENISLETEEINPIYTYESENPEVAETLGFGGLVKANSIGETNIKVTELSTGAEEIVPVTVSLLRAATPAFATPQVVQGIDFTAVLKLDGTVWTSGNNSNGQLRRWDTRC